MMNDVWIANTSLIPLGDCDCDYDYDYEYCDCDRD